MIVKKSMYLKSLRPDLQVLNSKYNIDLKLMVSHYVYKYVKLNTRVILENITFSEEKTLSKLVYSNLLKINIHLAVILQTYYPVSISLNIINYNDNIYFFNKTRDKFKKTYYIIPSGKTCDFQDVLLYYNIKDKNYSTELLTPTTQFITYYRFAKKLNEKFENKIHLKLKPSGDYTNSINSIREKTIQNPFIIKELLKNETDFKPL